MRSGENCRRRVTKGREILGEREKERKRERERVEEEREGKEMYINRIYGDAKRERKGVRVREREMFVAPSLDFCNSSQNESLSVSAHLDKYTQADMNPQTHSLSLCLSHTHARKLAHTLSLHSPLMQATEK